MVAAGLNVLGLNFLKELVVSPKEEHFINLGMIALCVLSAAVITLIMERYSTRYFELKLARYREELAERILHAEYSKVQKRLTRLAPVLMVEVNEVNDFGKLIPTFVTSMVQIVAIMIYLVFLSWKLSIIVLGLFGLVSVIMFIVLPSIKKLKDKRSKTRFTLYANLDLMNKGFKDLIMNRSHGKSYVNDSIRPPSLETAKYNGGIHMLKIGVEQAINILLILGFGIAIILYLNWVQSGEDLAVQFMALLLFILPSFIRIVDFFNQLKNAENGLDQINSLDIEMEKELVQLSEEVSFNSNKGNTLISLKSLEYSYNQNEHGFKLGPVDLDIAENEITIINGGNGSGKTTIFNLITGLYPPIKGELMLQGQKINQDNLRSYRDLFCSYFTDSPVFDNLSHIPKENFEWGERYIKELELEGKTSLSNSAIDEINLSFGQRGRLNLLRLLLEDRPIYILDEWAANQDIYFKEKFYTEIIPDLKKRGKTIILISHDDKYYEIADKIVTMRNGSIETIRKP